LKSKNSINTLIGKFESIYFVTSGNLRSYEQNFRLLREKMDSDEFINNLEKLNHVRTSELMKDLIKKGPIQTIENENVISEVYTNSFIVSTFKMNKKNTSHNKR
jgi:hypothetical protein